MEIALDAAMPTYSGGLGVLAGDTIRSFADLGLDAVAVTLLHRKGYFRQQVDPEGRQSETPVDWRPEDFARRLEPRVCVEIEGLPVWVCAWQHDLRGVEGAKLPTYLLDTDLPENRAEDRRLTDSLYLGDDRHRLRQEAVLGIGGVRMLRALGHESVERFHLNEGHAALAVAELLDEIAGECPLADDAFERRVEAVRHRCVFTTHTPVPAGHDQFGPELACQVLGERTLQLLGALDGSPVLNMTEVALRASHFVNGVAMRHGEVSRDLFPDYPIRSITNGIHPATWASPSFCALFDRHVPDWRRDAFSLRYAIGIPLAEVGEAHARSKAALIAHVNETAAAGFDPHALTIGFARRATAYKRPALLFREPERLAAIAKQVGPIQVVFAGKAHPRDGEGKESILRIFEARAALQDAVKVVYLPDYDVALGKLLCAGCDLWLNTPIPGLEASGTSGMKAALNGVPSLSVLDGWWLEGCVEGATGWAIGSDGDGRRLPAGARDRLHADALYEKLRDAVVPCFYDGPERYLEMRRFAIALNASFFNTQRMALQYLYEAYPQSARAGTRRRTGAAG